MRPCPAQGVLFGTQPVHVFRFDPSAVRVDPRGNPLGEKLRLGAWRCVMCAIDGEMAEAWGADCCPGRVEPVAAGSAAGETGAMAA